MTPAEITARLRRYNLWRRGNLDGMPQPDPREIGEAIDAAVEMIERMEKMQSALRRHHEMAMGAGLDPSPSLTKLRVSAYQQTCLYADTVAALEESGSAEKCVEGQSRSCIATCVLT